MDEQHHRESARNQEKVIKIAAEEDLTCWKLRFHDPSIRGVKKCACHKQRVARIAEHVMCSDQRQHHDGGDDREHDREKQAATAASLFYDLCNYLRRRCYLGGDGPTA